MKFLRRKWRSVSFRAGAVAGLLAGIITTLGLLLLLTLAFGTVFITTAALQLSAMDRIRDQLELGVAPDELRNVDGVEDVGGVDDGDSFWAVSVNGEVVASRGEVREELFAAGFERDSAIDIETDGDSERVNGIKNAGGEEWFYAEEEIEVGEASYTLVTATSGIFGLTSFIRSALPFTLPLIFGIMAVTGFLTAFFSRRALRSVEKMRVEVEQITRESLDRRVPGSGAEDGIDKLAATMNDMLERLETSSLQQGQFLADASHELRSPVAGLLAQLDVAASYPDRVDTDTLLPKLRDEAQRLRLLVDDLLFLSRSEAQLTHRPPPTPERVALDRLLEAEVAHQGTMRPDVSISVGGATGVVIAGPDRDLTRAVRNLVDNAARHAVSSVTLSVDVIGGMASVTIRDDGAGVAPEDVERIFERFIRLDEARSRDVGGSGLGLAIVSEIARQLGGSVGVIDLERPGATFRLLLPLAPGIVGP